MATALSKASIFPILGTLLRPFDPRDLQSLCKQRCSLKGGGSPYRSQNNHSAHSGNARGIENYSGACEQPGEGVCVLGGPSGARPRLLLREFAGTDPGG